MKQTLSRWTVCTTGYVPRSTTSKGVVRFVLQLVGPRKAVLDTALDFFTACAVRIIQDSGFGSAPLGFTVVSLTC